MEKNSTILYTDLEPMFEDHPRFKEMLWEWRAFSIGVDSDICRNILSLPIKDGNSIKMLERFSFAELVLIERSYPELYILELTCD
jgi:hypothetical protein